MESRFKNSKAIFWCLIGLFLFISAATAEIITDKNGGGPWSAVPGRLRFTPSFPDRMSRYDVFNFKPGTGDFDLLKLTGHYPHARYFSVSLYQVGTNTAVGSIVDFEIIPDDCPPNGSCNNPFAPGTDRGMEETGTYTIWLMEEGAPPPDGAENILFYPSGVDALTVLTRVYRPDIGYNALGGVSLPTIEALKIDGTAAISPESGFGIIDVRGKTNYFIANSAEIDLWDIKKSFAGDEVVFFHTPPGGAFPDPNIEYITASLEQYYRDSVAVITLESTPTFEDTCNGEAFQGGKDVRYWSFCVGGLGAMTTQDCLFDDQIKPNADGSVTIVIAGYGLKSDIVDAGLNYMRWGFAYKPKLLHRQILSRDDFKGKISSIDPLDIILNPKTVDAAYMDAHKAENWMGEYTPKGFIFSETEFFQRLNAGEFRQAY